MGSDTPTPSINLAALENVKAQQRWTEEKARRAAAALPSEAPGPAATLAAVPA